MLSLIACDAVRPGLETSELVAVPAGAVALFGADETPLDNASQVRRTERLEILMFSGGGAHGAFGAGVLNGWTQSGKRPVFDVVTGVSTGALLAVPAFLGPGYDAVVKRVYTASKDSDIYVERGIIAGLFGTAVNDSSPLARQIAAIVDDRVIAEVAAEHAKGRRLYVATTNLDAGKLVVWDLGKVATSGDPGRLALFRKVLLASASIPGFFDPVFIPVEGGDKGQMHVDGGVKAPILLRSWMLDVKARTRNVYAVVNAPLALTDRGGEVEAKLLRIAERSISELLRGLLYKTLYQAYVTARNAKADFRLVYVPDGVKDTPATSFDAAAMAELFEIGRSAGAAGPGAWRSEPPRLERFEKM